jgi:flagellar motor switch protein FliG
MDKVSGVQKAAIALLALGEEASAPILKSLSPDEIQKLGSQMSNIQAVDKQITDEVLNELIARIQEAGGITLPGNQFLHKLLPAVLGREQAESVLAKIEEDNSKVPFKNIQDIDTRILANFIRGEHPQTIAIILAHLGHEKASEVIGLLPENLQFEAVSRIANLETVPPDLLREVDEVLEKELLSISKGGYRSLGGIQSVAEILNRCDRRTGDNIMEALEDSDPDLADKIRKLMFVFDDLVWIDDVGIRELLKEISNDDLTLALKTASEEVKNKILKNLSQRASQMLLEDIEVMGPVRLSDVERAQQNILNVARRLEKEGRLILARGESGDTFV